jgi:DNA topoisomerase-1
VKGEKLLGTDPSTGKPMSVRVGRFGPLVQIGDNDDEEKKYASLRPGQSIETITIEEALDLFKLPRALGEFNNQKITAAIGRFGPYVKYGSLFASVPKDRDIFELTLP